MSTVKNVVEKQTKSDIKVNPGGLTQLQACNESFSLKLAVAMSKPIVSNLMFLNITLLTWLSAVLVTSCLKH